MHFIVFHYVIVCFIAFHLFSLAVGGGMAQEHHFSGDAVPRAEWNQTHPSSPAPLPFPPLRSPQVRNRFPVKLRYFLLWGKANLAFPPHKALPGEASSSKYLEVSKDMRPRHSFNHREEIFEVLHSSHPWYFLSCPDRDVFSLDLGLQPYDSWCLGKKIICITK